MGKHEEKKAKIIQLMKEAVQGGGESCDCGGRARHLKYLLIVSLIATTLPHPIANVFFSLFALFLALVLALAFRRHIARRFAAACLLLSLGSIATGCAPLLQNENPEIIALCQEISCERFAVVRGVRVLGIPVKRTSVEHAKFAAGITKIFATEIITGAGLVSIDQVRVYGS